MNTKNPYDYIPVKPITDLNSLEAAAQLSVNGLINEERVQGDLVGMLAMNGLKSKVTVSGSLLGEISAQIGGSLVALFTPNTVDLYKVPRGAFIVINGLWAVCVKPKSSKATTVLDELNPQRLLTMLITSDAARGEFVGKEKVNGRLVNHYVIDGESFLSAAKQSANPQLRLFGEGLWSAGDADLYLDAKEGYPVAFRGNYSGAYEPLKFKGNYGIQVELTGINSGIPVDLPVSCNDPISI